MSLLSFATTLQRKAIFFSSSLPWLVKEHRATLLFCFIAPNLHGSKVASTQHAIVFFSAVSRVPLFFPSLFSQRMIGKDVFVVF